MRKITKEIIAAFLSREKKTIGNSRTDGITLYLHDNAIAMHSLKGTLRITTAGWNTPTTRRRLNGLPGVNVYVKLGQLHLNNQPWDGTWTDVR